MVKFGRYFESMVEMRPEWRNAYVNYHALNQLLGAVKNGVFHRRAGSDGSLQSVSPQVVCGQTPGPCSPFEQRAPNGGDVDDDGEDVIYTKNGRQPSKSETSPLVSSSQQAGESQRYGGEYRHLPIDDAVAYTEHQPSNLESAASQEPKYPDLVDVPQGLCCPMVSREAAAAALQFEDCLLSEVNKSSLFAKKSYCTYRKFFNDNYSKWKAKGIPPRRAKDSLRFVTGELSHLLQFIETNTLAVKTALKKYLNSHPFYVKQELEEQALLDRYAETTAEIAELQNDITVLWADLFNDSDVSEAKIHITTSKLSVRQSFRSGMFFALIVAEIMYYLHVAYELKPSRDVVLREQWIFPVGRFCVTIVFAQLCWSWVLWNFDRRRINYLYVFEFQAGITMTWLQCLEYALMMMFLCILCCILFVRSNLHEDVGCYASSAGFPYLAPYCLPFFLVVWTLTMLIPIRHVMKKTRHAFAKVLWKCVKLPFGDVRFVEFFVADWGTSLMLPCGDFLYLVCFYTAGAKYAFTNDPVDVCSSVEAKFQYPVAMIPFFWRACQTFKMWRRTGLKAHLINHGKYQSFMVFFVFSWANALWPSGALNVLQWTWHVVAEIYAWIWDVLMDWGWIQGRERRMMFKGYWPYVTAAIVDFVLRHYFILCTLYVQPRIGPDYMLLIQAVVEVFRRSMWSIFRIENENLNNLEMYRKIDFVPHVVVDE